MRRWPKKACSPDSLARVLQSHPTLVSCTPMRTALKKFVPARLRPLARRAYYLPSDALDSLLGRRHPLTPPRGLANVGGGDFSKIGERSLLNFVEVGGLKPEDRVLDVGCGVGRMAVPMTRYLMGEGSYDGFDIVEPEIEWCRRAIGSKFPNFRFRLADIHNKEYNPAGRFKASEYEFPYEAGSFDFVLLTSVFTHMLPDELDNYLSEIRRVLRAEGRCFGTFFLLNRESLDLVDSGESSIDFRYDFGRYRVKEKNTPEAAIAYDEPCVRDLYEKHGLCIEEPIRYGSWSGRKPFLDYQDVVIASKTT